MAARSPPVIPDILNRESRVFCLFPHPCPRLDPGVGPLLHRGEDSHLDSQKNGITISLIKEI